MDRLAELFGKIHPIVLHFPLVLLVVGAAAECAGIFREAPFFSRASLWCFALGTLTAALAVGSGWLLAAHEHIRADQHRTLEWHRWLAVATTAAAALGWILTAVESTGRGTWVRRGVVIVAAILVVATGYFGGDLVWGHDWFQLSS